MRRRSRPFLAAILLVLVAGCHDDPAGPGAPVVPPAVRDFVERESLPMLRNIVVDVAIPIHDLTLFSAEYGPPHDCPSGCFYAHAFGTVSGAKIGWMGFSLSSDVPPAPTMFDLAADDAALFDANVWSRIEADQSWQFWNVFLPYLARDGDTPGEALLRIATRLETVIYPFLATELLRNPRITMHTDVLQVLACLPDSYALQRQAARDLLGPSFPGCEQPESVLVTVTASQSRFSRNNPVRLTVTAENRSPVAVEGGYGSSTCWLTIHALHDGAPTLIEGARPCTADYTLRVLAPGATRTEGFTLDGLLQDWYPYPTIAPGIYEIRGRLNDFTSAPILLEYYIDPAP